MLATLHLDQTSSLTLKGIREGVPMKPASQFWRLFVHFISDDTLDSLPCVAA